ncbi:MAG: SH3 domain-containing protein [Candidatus Peribacteraceae bacterium]|nr:SH3 domain-containing protein [Candidatus Peribacteraceae bacterium]
MSRSTLTFFLLIVSFGILFAGCGKPEPDKSFDEFTFSDTDLETVHDLADDGTVTTLSGSVDDTDYTDTSVLSVAGTGSTVLTDSSVVTPNKEKQAQYDALRTVVVDAGGNVYRVNNPFLNVRSEMDVSSSLVVRLNQGDILTVLDIPSAEWAKVKLSNGSEGYVAFRYLAKLTTEEKLPQEKTQFEGKYYVDFQFLNIRKEPSTQSEKVGELPGQAIIKPISMNGEWARVAYDGKEGYVSTQYLEPFQPVFLVRMDTYTLPILQYFADDTASIGSLAKQVAALKAAGKKIVTLKSFYDTVLAQETRDSRVSPDTVVLTITGVNAKNVRAVSDALQAAAVGATLFVQTKDVGVTGITEKTVLNLMANGNELQSAGHTGDDLRSMTDSQVMLELGQSKKLLEDITRREVYAISYPKGGVNDRVMKQAAELGYLFGISQSPDSRFSRSQFLRLPTLLVSPGMSPEDVVTLVK